RVVREPSLSAVKCKAGCTYVRTCVSRGYCKCGAKVWAFPAIMYLAPRQARASSEESVVEKGRRAPLDKVGVGVGRTDQSCRGREENTREGVRFERANARKDCEHVHRVGPARSVGFALTRQQKTNKETRKAGAAVRNPDFRESINIRIVPD
ncbi:Uncharacterized protein DBV15_01531, partial [Temnothorax longispinosus]